VRLRRLYPNPASRILDHQLPPHPQGALERLEVTTAKTAQLSTPQTSHQQQPPQRVQTIIADVVSEASRLGERPHRSFFVALARLARA
jgi:hypothetical protein